MPEINVIVPGTPIAKKRPRFARRGKFVTTYNEQETEEGKWLTLFMASLGNKDSLPIIQKGTPVFLTCKFIMPVPSSTPKRQAREIEAGKHVYHTKKPDCDNCLKFVKDCLNNVVWADDSQVAGGSYEKYYGTEARTEIRIFWED